jgi:hypothetical protein
MSTPVVVVPAVKKVRVPTTLPAKYGKFIQFGYYLMNKLNAVDSEDAPPLVDQQLFLDKWGVFAPLADQQAFVQEFFDSSKNINAELRKMLQQRKRDAAKAEKEANKPPKPEKKPRQSKKTQPTSEDTPIENDKKPRGRAKKLKTITTEDQLVNELVQLAQADSPTLASPVPTPQKKLTAQAAVSTLLTDVPPIQDQVKTPPLKKPAAVKEKNPKKPATQPATQPEQQDEEEEELQVSVFEFQNQKYLMDDHNNVYDLHSHQLIGSFHNNSLSLI